MKMPFIKFYVRDWQADPELRMCSLESRGLWFEMLCIMHNAKRRGYLETPTGLPLDDDQASRIIGTFKDDLYRCKEELLSHGVPSVEEETGIWYCRRMVKDTAKSEKCSDAAKRGGGNPILKSNIEDQKPEPRNHISLKGTFKGGEDYSDLINEEAIQKLSEPRRNALRLWQLHCTENRREMKTTALALLLDKWKDVSDARFIAAVKYSIGSNYNGIYEEGTKQGKQKKMEAGIR